MLAICIFYFSFSALFLWREEEPSTDKLKEVHFSNQKKKKGLLARWSETREATYNLF